MLIKQKQTKPVNMPKDQENVINRMLQKKKVPQKNVKLIAHTCIPPNDVLNHSEDS